MLQVEQSILNPPHGDCFAACIASVLELRLDEVPNYTEGDWWQRWQEWLKPRNLQMLSFTIRPENETWEPAGYTLLCARSPRGEWDHSVVCRDGKIVWDPHPQREMGVGRWVDWTIFAVIDPARSH